MLGIKLARMEMNQTQEQFGHLIGVDRTTVAKWEAGQAAPRVETLIKISEVTGWNMNDLVTNTHVTEEV